MKNRSIRVQRIYKNTAGEILRIDTISESGTVLRDKAFVLPPREMKKHPVSGNDVWDFGNFKFHSNGREVQTEIFQTTTTRTVNEVELVGGFTSHSGGPDYDNFTWQYGTVYMTDLPGTGDTV
jgi:hypothetical protein